MSASNGGGAANTGGLYAPLRQIVSDSESDDECRQRSDHAMIGSEGCNNSDINSGLHVKNNYSLSDLDDLNTNGNTVDTTMDNVSFLHSETSNKMSLARKVSFIASILTCVFTVIIFLWVIPCSETGCDSNTWRDKTTSWELPYDEIELSGSVQVVDAAQPNSKNLIFIYRGNHMRQRHTKDEPIDNGVVLIVGNSGKIGWYTREFRIPTKIDCHLLDVNMDGRKDCLVGGTEGLLATINPLSGTYHWYLHRKNGKSNIVALDFPVVIKDFDKDGVDDLMTSATILPNTDHNSLLLVSGATGLVVGDPFIVADCTSVHNIVVNSFNITYSCRSNSSEALRVLSYSQLQQHIFKPEPSPSRHSWPVRKDRLNLTLKKSIGNTINFFKNGKGKLMMENSGECPDNCRVSVKLVLEKNGTVWQYAANHVYGVRPSSFSFADSIHGFVLKL